jgi:hypothetical protein
MPVYIPPTPPGTGILRYELVDTGGVLRDLTQETSPDLFVSKGAVGMGRPAAELVLEKLPFAAGSVLRYARTDPLEINLPIFAQKMSMPLLLQAIETLREWFYTGDEQAATPVYLRVRRPQDNAERQIACYYAGGLEGNLGEGTPQHAAIVVSLIAPDPYWTDVEESELAYDQSDIGDTLSLINTGDADAYPVWTISGPASGITLTNLTTNKTLALTADGGLSLLATDTLTIDTRPSTQRDSLYQIYDQDGASYYSRVVHGGALWWLKPLQNNFRIDATGTSGDTSFGLRWLPRYRGALR